MHVLSITVKIVSLPTHPTSHTLYNVLLCFCVVCGIYIKQAVFNATDRGAGSSLNFTKLQRNIDSISTVLPFRLPPFYTFIIRTLSILEGLAINIDPNFRLIRGAYPFIAKQILESPNKEMTDLLKSGQRHYPFFFMLSSLFSSFSLT